MDCCSNRHKRAISWTLAMLVVLGLPIFLLAKVLHNNALRDLQPLGQVQEFAYATTDGTSAFTHYDTFKRVSFLLQLPADCASDACDQAIKQFLAIKSWADDKLLNKNPHDSKPAHINFVLLSPKPVEIDGAEIKQIEVSADQPYIIPKSVDVKPGEPLCVAISQESVFAFAEPCLGGEQETKIKRLLSSLTTEAYLFHYLTMQSLMWKRAKDYARGKISTGDEQDN